MKNHFASFLMIVSTAFQTSLLAQSLSPTVLSSDGGIDANSFMSLEWTVGEPAVETYTGPTRGFTEGFHQPVPEVNPQKPIIAGISFPHMEEVKEMEEAISFYPNPVSTSLTVNLHEAQTTSLFLRICASNGTPVLNNVIQQEESKIQMDLSALPSGIYFLQVIDHNGNLISINNVSKI